MKRDFEDFDELDELLSEKKARKKRKRNTGNGIIIACCVIIACIIISCVYLIISRTLGGEQETGEQALEIEVEENIVVEGEPAEEKDTTSVGEQDVQTEDINMEGESEEPLHEEQEAESSDPQTAAVKESGAEIDVAQLVSASNVGENSSVTYGIDVSRFQGTIDWAQVAGTGIDFAMIRVGYRDAVTGEIKDDSNAKYNMQEAEKNGIKIGAYFFSTAISAQEAAEEAEWVANYIAKYPITYPVGFNCEGFENASSRQYSLTKDERSSIALAFLDKIYNAGYTPIFYASRGELSEDAQWNTSQIEQKYKIWMAWYNQDTSKLASGPSYEGQCAMWQYSDKGTVAGIGKSVDVDVAYFGYGGTETAKDTSERETVSADVEALMNFEAVDETVTAKNSTNLRDKPSQGSDSTVKVTLQNGQTARRTGISDSGWSRVIYEGGTYYAVSGYLTTDMSAPEQEITQQPEDTSGFKTKFMDCNETVTAKEVVNLRNKPSVTDEDSVVVATLYAGDTAVMTGVNAEFGWARVEYNGQTLYCVSSYLKYVE
ncbi:MAG: glycoside hydrolase family 25 [Lachnospiraceae bacterium]|nr:glycoside hydrolase family 25 [Lachnospiraceae bacterium]